MTSVIAPAVPTKEPKEDANVAMPDVDPASAPLVRLEIFPANYSHFPMVRYHIDKVVVQTH